MTDPTNIHDYRVNLNAYSGPLDLLLYLVHRHEIDLNNIPIAQLTQQYLEHLKRIERVDVELAGEFLVMAATLLEIKSAMLLPRPEANADSSEQEETATTLADPRYELIQQLLAYKRFKDAAGELTQQREQWNRRYPYRPVERKTVTGINCTAPNTTTEMIDVDLETITILDLYQAYARVLETVGHQPAMHEVIYDDNPYRFARGRYCRSAHTGRLQDFTGIVCGS